MALLAFSASYTPLEGDASIAPWIILRAQLAMGHRNLVIKLFR
jgi:hypothetical protein